MPRRSNDRVQFEETVVNSIEKILRSPKVKAEIGRMLDRIWNDAQAILEIEAEPKKRKPKAEKAEKAEKSEGDAPKKRGRKPKAESQATEGDAPKKRRGRPPKAEKVEGEAPKKRRGRPPKAEKAAEAEAAKDDEESEPEGDKDKQYIVLVRPASKLDWWPADEDGTMQWATIDPEGGYVARVEPKYGVDKSEIYEIKHDWNEEHNDQTWQFDVRAAA